MAQISNHNHPKMNRDRKNYTPAINKTTSLHFSIIMSTGSPLNAGRMETHEAMNNFALSATLAAGEHFPSKQHLFLSFHIAQILAINDKHHIVLPLGEANWRFQASNKSPMPRGNTQLQPNPLRIEFHTCCTIKHCMRTWSTDSSTARHIGHALMIVIFCLRRLSTVRMYPRATQASQT